MPPKKARVRAIVRACVRDTRRACVFTPGKVQQFYKGNMSCVLEYNTIARYAALGLAAT